MQSDGAHHSSKLIIGCGYLGWRVALRWLAAGETVSVLTRSAERAEELAGQGLSTIVGDVTERGTLKLPKVDTVLYAVGYDRLRYPSMHAVYVDGLRNVLDALPPGIERFIYISSTGVYGRTEEPSVNEDTPPSPNYDGGECCLAAEKLLEESYLSDRLIVLRMAGIYGPGRLPLREKLMSGKVIPSASDGHVNLINVDDAASAVLAAERVEPPRRYLISDGQPVMRRDFYAELARLIGAPPPQFAHASPEQSTGRGSADKHICNDRMRNELQITLRYPTYREGLAAAVLAEDGLS